METNTSSPNCRHESFYYAHLRFLDFLIMK